MEQNKIQELEEIINEIKDLFDRVRLAYKERDLDRMGDKIEDVERLFGEIDDDSNYGIPEIKDELYYIREEIYNSHRYANELEREIKEKKKEKQPKIVFDPFNSPFSFALGPLFWVSEEEIDE